MYLSWLPKYYTNPSIPIYLIYICVYILTNLFFVFWSQTIFLPVVGLVDPDTLKPGDLVGVNKDSYLILDTLPSEYDSRVKAMEVDEKPTEDYNDIGGLEKQVNSYIHDLGELNSGSSLSYCKFIDMVLGISRFFFSFHLAEFEVI